MKVLSIVVRLKSDDKPVVDMKKANVRFTETDMMAFALWAFNKAQTKGFVTSTDEEIGNWEKENGK